MIKLFSNSFYTTTDKYHEQSAILPMSVNLAVLRIAVVVRIPVSENRKTPRFFRFLGQVGPRLLGWKFDIRPNAVRRQLDDILSFSP